MSFLKNDFIIMIISLLFTFSKKQNKIQFEHY